ncbi:MAG: hypothetical protein R2705_06470 [Ilumatobacteraceae bacterium]
MWFLEDGDLVRRLLTQAAVDGGGQELERVHPDSSAWEREPNLIGTAGDSRPVVQLPDGKPYVVATSGALTRLAEGTIDAVRNGWYAETVCTLSGRCSLAIHGSADPLNVAEAASGTRVSFAPGGGSAAVLEPRPEGTRLQVLDLTTGLSLGELMVTDGSVLDPTVVWSPGAKFVIVVRDGALVVLDVNAHTVLDLGLAVPEGGRLVGAA